MRFTVKTAGLAALLVAACQGPDEYFHGPFDGGAGPAGVGGQVVTGSGGTASGVAGSGPGAGGIPTGLGGTGPGAGGSTGNAGAIGSAGSGGSSAGTAGGGGTTSGAAGTTSGRGGTTGTAGNSATGRGGTTGTAGDSGAAGVTGTGGRGGTTGTAGTTGAAGTTGTGRGGTTGAAGSATTGMAGTTGAGGASSSHGGTTGAGGATGTGGGTGTVLYSDDFESETLGATSASGWSRTGGSSGDWTIATDGTKVLEQNGSNSSTVRFQSLTGAGASGSPWTGALSASARVKMIAAGSSNQAALVCVRYNDASNRYCGALVPGGVQILTSVGGTAGGSAVFSGSVTTGTFYDLRISVDASNTLTVFLDGTQKGTYTPAAMTNGTVALGTASMEAAFDDISVTRP